MLTGVEWWKNLLFSCKELFFHGWWYLGFFECWNLIMPLFSLFPVWLHSPSMVFFSSLLSILKVVGMKSVKVRRHHKVLQNDGECVVPENIHTSPTEYSLICIPPPPRILCSRGLWWPPSPQEFPEFLNGDFLPPSEIQSSFSTLKKEVNTNSVTKTR